MLCIYFEIPYEQQLMRIAPRELQTILTLISETAQANGGQSFSLPCATVYCFRENTAAPIFSVSLFLQFLTDILRIQKKRIADYRIIIDYFSEKTNEDAITAHFSAYKNRIIPNRSFFAAPHAETLLYPYISFEYKQDIALYSFDHFIIPQQEAETAPPKYALYLPEGVSVYHALYHFMLLYPIAIDVMEKYLTPAEFVQYTETKNVQAYFRRNRFAPEYPDFFTEAFATFVSLYFHVFAKVYGSGTLEITVYTPDEQSDAAQRMLTFIPFASIKKNSAVPVGLGQLPPDFKEMVYLDLLASRFIFDDEREAFFRSCNKGTAFIEHLNDWMYALGIVSVKNDLYSTVPLLLPLLEQQLGAAVTGLHRIIASFLWAKYKTGTVNADSELKTIFSHFQFTPDDYFLLHYILRDSPDDSLMQKDLSEWESAGFYPALESYQKTLRMKELKHYAETMQTAKTAVKLMQDGGFLAGEYRGLSFIAALHLSQNKREDACSYFQYALDNAEMLHDPQFICEALFNLGTAYFLQSAFHAAAHAFEQLSGIITDSFEQSYEIPCRFMQGRLALQLGEYRAAEQHFKTASETAAQRFPSSEPLCRVWYARSLVYSGQTYQAKQLFVQYSGSIPEAQAFLLEAQLLGSRISDETSAMPDAEVLFSAAPTGTYHSGFAFAEDRIWSGLYGKPAAAVLYKALLSCCRFKSALSENAPRETLQAHMSALEETARTALHFGDTYAPLYLYLCYEAGILLDGRDSDAAGSYLSRAFRALQNNMKSITENTIRDHFLFHNVWNAKLYAAAQEHKLV